MNTTHLATIISADGKCLKNPPEDLETLHLIIDGKQIIQGDNTLTGNSKYQLPKSIQYQLTTFEPQEDGTCLAQYERVNSDLA